MSDYDPRFTLAREDLADQALEGLVRARRYAPTAPMQAVSAVADLRSEPGSGGGLVDQLVFGEAFDVLETRAGSCWGQARRDGAVGWVAAADLAAGVLPPTHRVSALAATVRSAPEVSAEASLELPLNALVTVEAFEGPFARLIRGGWVLADQVARLDAFDRDPASVAERLLDSPYQEGGRTPAGLDGMALVQQALYACGLGGPRRAQELPGLGRAVDGESDLRRSDVVGWRDDAAIMVDADRVVLADAQRGAVVIEALATALARNGAPVALRRPG